MHEILQITKQHTKHKHTGKQLSTNNTQTTKTPTNKYKKQLQLSNQHQTHKTSGHPKKKTPSIKKRGNSKLTSEKMEIPQKQKLCTQYYDENLQQIPNTLLKY